MWQVCVRGLKEPIGSRIRCLHPETIEKALEFVHYIIICTNETISGQSIECNPRLHLIPRFMRLNPLIYLPRPFTFLSPFKNMPGPSHRSQRQLIEPMPNRSQIPLNCGPTRTQQMFSASPSNLITKQCARWPEQKPHFSPPNNGPKALATT